MLVPVQPALAETALGAPIKVGLAPFAVAVKPGRESDLRRERRGHGVGDRWRHPNSVVGQRSRSALVQTMSHTTRESSSVRRELQDGTVSVINAVTNTVVGPPIAVGPAPRSVAVNSVTNRIYVSERYQ